MENDRTLAEINRTVQENIRPIGSMIKLNTIGVDVIDDMCHSRSVTEDNQMADNVFGSRIRRIDHIISLAVIEIGVNCFIIENEYKT